MTSRTAERLRAVKILHSSRDGSGYDARMPEDAESNTDEHGHGGDVLVLVLPAGVFVSILVRLPGGFNLIG